MTSAFAGPKRLPVEFSKALKAQDGGVSNYSSFRHADYCVPLPAFLTVEALMAAARNRSAWGTPEGVVVIASGAHDWLGFDYRHAEEPAVVYEETDQSGVELVANSFEALLDGLVED